MDRRMVLASGALFSIASLAKARAEPAAAITVDGRVALGALRGMVEEHLMGVLGAAKTLAATSEAQSGRWMRVRPALSVMAQQTPTAAAVWFARPDGSYHTVADGLVGANLKDRDYFPGLMAGRDVHSALVISKSTGLRSAVVAAPVVRAGQVAGAIGASIEVRQVSELVERKARLPANLVFYALDRQGRTAIHKDPALMFEFPSDMGDPTLTSAVATMLSKNSGKVEYEFRGSRRTALFEISAFTGWRFVLAAVHG